MVDLGSVRARFVQAFMLIERGPTANGAGRRLAPEGRDTRREVMTPTIGPAWLQRRSAVVGL